MFFSLSVKQHAAVGIFGCQDRRIIPGAEFGDTMSSPTRIENERQCPLYPATTRWNQPQHPAKFLQSVSPIPYFCVIDHGRFLCRPPMIPRVKLRFGLPVQHQAANRLGWYQKANTLLANDASRKRQGNPRFSDVSVPMFITARQLRRNRKIDACFSSLATRSATNQF